MGDTQSRKWQLTINNPQDKGFTHIRIAQELQGLKSLVYYCMADEAGQTHHTHVYAAFSSAVRFSTLKARFPEAHLESVRGSTAQNRDYITKSGKWENDVKHGTKIPGTFEEWGDIPPEQQGRRSDLSDLYEMVKNGADNLEILETYPKAMMYLDKVERVRQVLKAEQYSTEFRSLEVTYIWGQRVRERPEGLWKSMDMIKFAASPIMTILLNGITARISFCLMSFAPNCAFPICSTTWTVTPLMLPCRYTNRQACYTKVFLISNVSLNQQYRNIQFDEPYTWAAFCRRIHHVVEYTAEGSNLEHPAPDLEEMGLPVFTELDDCRELPF